MNRLRNGRDCVKVYQKKHLLEWNEYSFPSVPIEHATPSEANML